MHPKIKRQPAATPLAIRTVKPLVLHDVTNGPGRGLRRPAAPAASGPANHARHHVPRQAQA